MSPKRGTRVHLLPVYASASAGWMENMSTLGRPDARSRIIQVLAETGALSRADLARATLLAFSTVSALVSDLQDEGLVTEDMERSTGGTTMGRPATLLRLGRKAGLAVGVEVGKQHIRAVMSDLAHSVLAERSHKIDADLSAEQSVPLVVAAVEGLLEDADASRDEVVGVGLALPGPIRLPTSEVGDSSILPGWIGKQAKHVMENALQLDVLVGNDANLGALGEWIWGAGRASDDMVFVKAATGVGAGMILGGRLYTGSFGTAGEIGHTPVVREGPICRCGNRGCLEMVAGTQAILGALRATHGASLTMHDVVVAAAGGDAGCIRAVGDAGRAIGEAAAILCNLVNPDTIVIGGELAAGGELLLGPMREAIRRSSLRSAADDVSVVTGELGDRAVSMGAVGLVLRTSAERIAAKR